MKDGSYSISIHAPRVGGDHQDIAGNWMLNISIHAPRVGGDQICKPSGTGKNISIHAPRVGGDHSWRHQSRRLSRFQSTPPVWGATPDLAFKLRFDIFISIHAPRVGGDIPHQPGGHWSAISIHAPRVGGDRLFPLMDGKTQKFQSTPPVWGATGFAKTPSSGTPNFNPRPPCGGRLARTGDCKYCKYFNPRPPCGGRRGIWPAMRRF